LAECLLALLGDEDPAVFSAGAEYLKNTGYAVDCLKSRVERDQHGAVFAATRRAIELADVSSKQRDLVLSSVRVASLADEELLDLFLRLAERPADLSASRRAVYRARFAKELVERHADSRAARDSFAAPLLARIPDAAGRRAWLEITRNAGDGHWREEPSTELLAAAAADDDRSVRTFAYSWLAKDHPLSVDRLPHVAEDLAIEDATTRLDVVRSIGDGRSAALLVALRRVLDGARGDLRSATLGKMISVGRGDAAPDLVTELRSAPWQFTTWWFRILEEGLGSEVVARELVDLVKSDPTLLPKLAMWLRNDRQSRGELSSATVEAVIRGLPPDSLTPEVVSAVAMQLDPATVKPIVLQLLASKRREDVVAAIQLVSQLRIDAAWDTLAKLLETGDGEIKQRAIDALTTLREYRELRRAVLADEGDARRVAFEKARELMKSGKSDQRAGAALALAATADVAAIPLLLDLLGDEDATVRAAARLALEKLAERASAVMPADAPKKNDEKKKSGQ
jgi:HEAT repeat protein